MADHPAHVFGTVLSDEPWQGSGFTIEVTCPHCAGQYRPAADRINSSHRSTRSTVTLLCSHCSRQAVLLVDLVLIAETPESKALLKAQRAAAR